VEDTIRRRMRIIGVLRIKVRMFSKFSSSSKAYRWSGFGSGLDELSAFVANDHQIESADHLEQALVHELISLNYQ
jgi:hypothetical protein